MMEAGKGLWSLIQDQILGMKWLKDAVGAGLTAMGTDISSRLGGSVHFFIYDIIKITILLCTLIFVISYIQSYFPPERSKRILGRFHGLGARIAAAGFFSHWVLPFSAEGRLCQGSMQTNWGWPGLLQIRV